MTDSPDTEVVGGVTFELRPHFRQPVDPANVCLRKNRTVANRYLQLSDDFIGARMVEVGVDQGGSTSFFSKLLRPERLVAIELSDAPVSTVVDFLRIHDPDVRVELQWGVDQADRVGVPSILDQAFGDEPIDLVVDDASHLFVPSTATFEMLFPRLRPGGLFMLEDWSSGLLKERGLVQAMADDDTGEVTARIQAAYIQDLPIPTPMSALICQLVVAAGRHPDWISHIGITDDRVEVWRGTADIAHDTPIAEYVGNLGATIFSPTLEGG